MNMPLQPVPVPLYAEDDGSYRVLGSRVLLELVVHAFEAGDTPEEIVSRYDTLPLQHVYAVITWYLANQDEVRAYIRERDAKGKALEEQVRATQPRRAEIAARFAARRASQGGGLASPAQ